MRDVGATSLARITVALAVAALGVTAGSSRAEDATASPIALIEQFHATLLDVIKNPRHGNAASLSESDQRLLVAYLLQIDATNDDNPASSGDSADHRSSTPTLPGEITGGCATAAATSPAWMLSALVGLAWRRKRASKNRSTQEERMRCR